MSNPNIKPRWKPGESGNPKGRPKGTRSIPDMLRRFGEYDTPEALVAKLRAMFPGKLKGKKGIPLQEALWLSAYLHAIKGESWAFHLIADRLEGKPRQKIDSTLDGSLEINLNASGAVGGAGDSNPLAGIN